MRNGTAKPTADASAGRQQKQRLRVFPGTPKRVPLTPAIHQASGRKPPKMPLHLAQGHMVKVRAAERHSKEVSAGKPVSGVMKFQSFK